MYELTWQERVSPVGMLNNKIQNTKTENVKLFKSHFCKTTGTENESRASMFNEFTRDDVE